jgi:hypothetical protein
MIKPKCLPPGKKEIAYTTTGHIVPCCWLDNPRGWEEPQIKRLYQNKLKVSNNKDIESIVDSKEWNEFFKELKTDPSYTCKRFCSGPIDTNINRARENKHKPGKIKICTLYFDGKYTPDYVEKLYNSLKRNCTIPFEFICYSDNPNVKADVVIPLKPHSDIKYHWHKLSFFSPHFAYQKPGDEIIIMDIDQIITGNVDDMIGWPVADNELISYNKWWSEPKYGLRLNGGFYKFKSGSCQIIWDEFIRSPEKWQLEWYKKGQVHYKYFGEQNFVNWMCDKFKINLTLMPPEWVCKLTNDEKQDLQTNITYIKKCNKDYMILDKLNADIKVVHFASPNADIHTSKYEWIKDYWK